MTKMSEDKKTQEVRRKRVPLGVPRAKLNAPTKPGKVRRWVNDDGARLAQAQLGGYEFVQEDIAPGDPDVKNANRDLGSKVSVPVGKKDNGEPLYAYLMEIDEDIYKADQLEKERENERLEAAIRRGEDQHGAVGADGRYIPKERIKIE
jgi:hypothetical protein